MIQVERLRLQTAARLIAAGTFKPTRCSSLRPPADPQFADAPPAPVHVAQQNQKMTALDLRTLAATKSLGY